MQIEVRIKATNSNILRGDYDESTSLSIDIDPVTSESILNELNRSGFIASYVKDNDVSVNMRENPILKSQLTDQGEFFFTIPIDGMGSNQSFKGRVIFY